MITVGFAKALIVLAAFSPNVASEYQMFDDGSSRAETMPGAIRACNEMWGQEVVNDVELTTCVDSAISIDW